MLQDPPHRPHGSGTQPQRGSAGQPFGCTGKERTGEVGRACPPKCSRRAHHAAGQLGARAAADPFGIGDACPAIRAQARARAARTPAVGYAQRGRRERRARAGGVVTVVGVPQQKPTSPGASCSSFRLQASRTFTLRLRVPSRDGLAQKTAASELPTATATSTSPASERMSCPPSREASLAPAAFAGQSVSRQPPSPPGSLRICWSCSDEKPAHRFPGQVSTTY